MLWFGAAARQANKGLRQAGEAANTGYADISEMYDPYRRGGMGAWNTLLALAGQQGQGAADSAFGTFRASPGYQWRLNEGVRNVEGSEAARGSLYSGSTLKALQDRGEGLASQEYGNWTDMLRGLSDVGYGATGATAGARAQLAQLLAGFAREKGQNKANATLGAGNFFTNLALGGLGAFL